MKIINKTEDQNYLEILKDNDEQVLVIDEDGVKASNISSIQKQTEEPDETDFITKKYADETYGKASGDFPLTEDQVEFPLIIKEEKEYSLSPIDGAFDVDQLHYISGDTTHFISDYSDYPDFYKNSFVERDGDNEYSNIVARLQEEKGVLVDLTKVVGQTKAHLNNSGIESKQYFFKITGTNSLGNGFTEYTLQAFNGLVGTRLITVDAPKNRLVVQFSKYLETAPDKADNPENPDECASFEIGGDYTPNITYIGTLKETPTGKKVLAIDDEALEDWEFTINGSPVVKKVIVLDK